MINEMTQRKINNPTADGAFGIFWDEYHSIEQTPSQPTVPDEETNNTKDDFDKNETEIQWLSDVGFTNIANKIRERQPIDQNDDDMKMITASLTRSQANAVRRRIEYLNDIIQKNYEPEGKPIPTSSSSSSRRKKDVRDIFDTSGRTELSARPPAAAVSATKESFQRSQSCAVDETFKRHQRGQSPKTELVFGSSGSSPQRSYSERNTSPPPVPPKPKEQNRSIKAVTTPDGRHKKDPSKRKSPEMRKQVLSYPTSLESKRSQPLPYNNNNNTEMNMRTSGSFQASSETVNKSPGSQLTFMTGEEREKTLTDKTPKSNKTKQTSTPKLSSKKTDETNNNIDPNRRHSAFVDSKKEPNNNKVYRKAMSVDKTSYDTEVDGAAHSTAAAIDNNYIDVDDDSLDQIIDYDGISRTLEKAGKNKKLHRGGTVQSNSLTKQKTKNPYIDYNLSPTFSPQDIDIPYKYTTQKSEPNATSSLTPNISGPYTIPSPISNNRRHVKPSASTPNISSILSAPSTPDSPTIAQGSPTFTSQGALKQSRKDYPISSSPVVSNNNNDINNHESNNNRLRTDLEINDNNDKDSINESNRLSINSLSISNVSSNVELLHSCSEDSKSLSSHGSLGSIGSIEDFTTAGIDKSSLDDSNQKADIDIVIDYHNNESLSNEQSPVHRSDTPQDAAPQEPKKQPGLPSVLPNIPKFPPLPNFSISKDITGMTEVGDLSDTDMERVRPIALIELTAMFDAYNIPMNRRKLPLKPKFKDSGVFGVHLTTLSQREESKKHKEGRVPRVFKEMLIFLERHGLKEEGVLRIPGSALRVKGLREAIDRNDLNKVKWEERNVKDVAACIKQFLRDLPEPLLSHEYQNTFISVADLPDRKIQLQALNQLVILLKPVHQKTLKALLSTLQKIIDHEAYNKMGLDNVAMIMAPNLLLQSGNKIDVDGQQKAEVMTDIMRMLIKYQAILWTIPSFMVAQIRYVNDSGVKTKDPKTVLKIISKQRKSPNFIYGHKKHHKSDGSSGEELEQFEEEIIRVKAPSSISSKQSMAIKLTEETTAADVIAKFQWRRQNSQKEVDFIDTSRVKVDKERPTSKKEGKVAAKFHLYECGGNIGERRLESTANVSAILKVNPNATWTLKS